MQCRVSSFRSLLFPRLFGADAVVVVVVRDMDHHSPPFYTTLNIMQFSSSKSKRCLRLHLLFPMIFNAAAALATIGIFFSLARIPPGTDTSAYLLTSRSLPPISTSFHPRLS